MILTKKHKLLYLLRASFVFLIGIASYWIITSSYSTNQQELTFETAERALRYSKDLLSEYGDLSNREDDSLFAGDVLLNNSTFLVDKVERTTGFGCTIFAKNLRISTTASAADSDKPAIGTAANEEITQQVFKNGQKFKGITETIGKEWLILYEPIKSPTGETIGMIAVFKEYKDFQANLNGFKLIVALCVFFLVLFVQVLIWLAETRKNKLKSSSKKLNQNNRLLTEQKKELEKLTFVAEEINQAVAIISIDDRIEWINKSFEKNMQYSPEEAIGNKTSALLGGPETDRTVIRKMDEAIFVKQKAINATILQYRKDGSCYWARVYLTPLLNDAGELERYVAFSIDITAEKEAKDLLEASEANIRQIGETIDDAVYLYSIDYNRYDYISPKCLTVLGAKQSFFYAGQSYVDLFVAEEYKDLVLKSSESIAKGNAYDIEYKVIINNETRWVKERANPIVSDNGKIVKYSGICTDITENMLIQTQLNEAHKNLGLIAAIGLELNKELSISKIIEIVHSRIKDIMVANSFAIGIINEEDETLNFPKFIENNQTFENITYSLNDSILANKCIKEGQDIIIHDCSLEAASFSEEEMDHTYGDETLSLIYMPLRSKNEIIGVITVQSLSRNVYTKNQINLLKSLSINISNALVNARLYESLDKKVKERTQEVIHQKEMLEKSYREVKVLSEIGMEISSCVKLEDVVEELYKNVNKLLKADSFAVRIYDSKTQEIHYQYEFENGKRLEERFSLHIDELESYTVWCIRNRTHLFINDSPTEYKKYIPEVKIKVGESPNSLLVCPMIVDNRVIGVITVQSFLTNAYRQHDLDILKTLSVYTGIALNNAQLYETLETKVVARTKEVSKKNKEILDSINYTKNIQKATLTSRQERLKLLPKSFVYYKPKDIVSGDFFRIDPIKTRDNRNLVSFVVADCTGHGVPGASLAILCSSIIKQSLSEQSVFSPGEALAFARQQLNVFLHSSRSNIYDGMDLSFCVLNKDTNELYFSGAFNDCFILRGEEEFVLRGTRAHVGYQENAKEFTNFEFQLEPGDRIYLTTDGYTDQFGGPRDRKFTRKQFLSLLHEMKKEKINTQEDFFKERFMHWKGKNEQTDDVCVMGVEI